MNPKAVLHVLGALLIFIGASLLFPIAFSIYFQDGDLAALGISLAITVSSGFLLWKVTPSDAPLQIRDGFAVVSFGWMLLSAFGALPFVFADVSLSYTDAFFETMSGFTTTGATILSDVEAWPHGLLFWRSLTHWLGGMGIIVLSLAILPMLGVGGMQLFKAEVPGPSVDKLRPRIQDTAKILWGVYVALSAVEAVLLKLGGMSVFDALCHTFGTMATGGFSTKNLGIGHFQSSYIENVITLFMIIAGANFTLHYFAFRGELNKYWRNTEFRFYIFVILTATAILAVNVGMNDHASGRELVEKAAFQVASIMTTTGFHSADYETWPMLSQLLLVILMFLGGCAGSTGGGIKMVRIYLSIKYGIIQLKRLVHPNAVIPIRMGHQTISRDAITDVLGFVVVYIALFVLGSVFMAALGLDLTTSVSTVISTLGNIGPGIGTVGPTENYAHIPAVGKWMLSFLMLLGRLEIFTVLVLCNRHFWKR